MFLFTFEQQTSELLLTWKASQVNRVVGLSRGGLWVRVECGVTLPIYSQTQSVF